MASSSIVRPLSLLVSLALILHTTSIYQPLQTSIAFSIIGYHITDYLIPRISPHLVKIGLYGKDLSKKDRPIIPETAGVIPLTTYLFLMFVFIPFMFFKFLITDTSGGGNRESGLVQPGIDGVNLSSLNHYFFPHNKLSSYLSGMLSLESMVLLGLLDDLFDIRWRHKFFLPLIASIPLLIVYYVDFGVTSILIPTFIQEWFQLPFHNIDLGAGYYIYMLSVLIFCPNSVNILAGVNGLEVGQTVVLSILLLLNDLCYLIPLNSQNPLYDSHLFSSCILVPFLGCALLLLKVNWYPAKVFVGDTFCYFSGMVFAIVGILGHFSKTLLLFFIPQIFNFLYSAPQLFGIVPCPRHRLPRYDADDNKLHPSMVVFEKPLPKIVAQVLNILSHLRLLQVVKSEQDGQITQSNNFTLINLVLVWFGPMREDKLCALLMAIQFAIGIIGLVSRHLVAHWLFGFDNLSWPL